MFTTVTASIAGTIRRYRDDRPTVIVADVEDVSDGDQSTTLHVVETAETAWMPRDR